MGVLTVGGLTVSELTVGGLTVGEFTVGGLTVGVMTVGGLFTNKISGYRIGNGYFAIYMFFKQV